MSGQKNGAHLIHVRVSHSEQTIHQNENANHFQEFSFPFAYLFMQDNVYNGLISFNIRWLYQEFWKYAIVSLKALQEK